MKMRDAAWLASANLMKNPMRTLLTILGLGVGVAAVLTVVTLGSAGQTQVEREIDKLGVDKVWITPEQGSGAYLAEESAQRIADSTAAAASASARTAGAVFYGYSAQPAAIVGYDEAVQQVLPPTLKKGRGFTHLEYIEGSPVALIDETLQEAFGEDVVGSRITLGSRRITVVGVTASLAAQSGTGMVIMPLQTLMDTWPETEIGEITMNVPRDQSAEAAAAAALNVLGDGFRASTLQEEINAARSVIRIFVLVLASVAAVCMLTGGIGVMNILLVSVRERRREIGLMKAVGGTSGQIALLFLLEAVCYALLGGLAGLLLGMGMIGLFGRLIGLNTALSLPLAVCALGGAAALGVIFGVAPAVKAAAMLPANALRQD